MATAHIPPHAQLSEAAETRNRLMGQIQPRLQYFAHRALNVLGKRNDEVFAICIDVDDPRWGALGRHLMPNEDWQKYRDAGVVPLAQGTVLWSVCEYLAEEMPDISAVLLEKPPKGKFKAVVLAEQGCTVYEIEPKAG